MDAPAPAAPAAPATAQQEASTTTDAAPVEGAPKAPPKVDPKAEANQRLKAMGLKLKARDREVPVEDIDKLMHYAGKGFGAETLIEQGKRAMSEAEQVKRAVALLDSDNEEEAIEALRKLSPRAQALAEKLVLREYEAAQKQEKMTDTERQLAARLEKAEAERRALAEEKQAATRKEEEARHQQEFARVREEAFGVAREVLQALKVPPEVAPSVVPRVARLMRLSAQLETPLSPEQLTAAVQDELRGEWAGLVGGMDAEATLAWLGDDVGAKVARAWLARQRGLRSTGAPAAEGGQPKATANGTPKTSAEWARYWSGR